jgi:aconitase A
LNPYDVFLPQEIEYFEHGGILQYVLRQLAAK